MKKAKINLDELLDCFEEGNDEHQYYLDIETGKIELLIDEDYSGENNDELCEKIENGLNVRYFAVPKQDSHQGYKDMETFIETVKDENLRKMLLIAINGSGAFRRFKNVLFEYSQEQPWFDFQEERKEERCLEWLRDNDIKAEE
ncbi:MAG: UPF0158 family protein [Elusimicrobia bacterium]|nr:UPF0158 family protein [Elusimicrobiota bacterium]